MPSISASNDYGREDRGVMEKMSKEHKIIPAATVSVCAAKIVHPLAPVFDDASRVLILGTMPSPKSRELGFYYGHPQNRFWKVMAAVFDEDIAETSEARAAFCLQKGIALWDVIASCTIVGAIDASIRDVVVNDLSLILGHAPVQHILTTGRKAATLFARYCKPQIGRSAIALPSTSAANAAMKLDELVSIYRRELVAALRLS